MSIEVNIERSRRLLRSLKPAELEQQAAASSGLAQLARRQQGADAASRKRAEADLHRRELDDNQQQIEQPEQQLATNQSRKQEIRQELGKLQSESDEHSDPQR